ncbi:cellulose biosynthesis cyclic di-GMP-binding regulatory protein BcsB [Brasilonema sp. UFV-L1]|uniref:cellulose biosynthesis cyclic di-GMP-binding regulatory protein BcsB n=1 Tax=Brasilonema sp. UFV-L1 TaxID=2234130 RepID=UPI00145C95F0|nr:cellulose biosynthesis cyclic di-GMP-binding regulatory protein BcsB [Brasilonema sp. UFV-L1]NMG05780.1 cellulose biosynthesis cyclic di-GMP-binding regulatory protein BcsB [Brasilonema sp. UFV-L1]
MKPLFHLSKVSTKAIIFTFCLLLVPNSLQSAQARNQEDDLPHENSQQYREISQQPKYSGQQQTLLLAQAIRRNANSEDESEETESEADEPKNLIPYTLDFSRSPIVGNRMRLRGLNGEGRLGFNRPRGWKVEKLQALIRFQHSPSLYANRSNLTVLINDTAVGSVPLKSKQSQISEVRININPRLLQDYNEIKFVAQQNTSQQCTDPHDPNLWTEILPDSKLIFGFQRQPIPLNFSRYPYPFFDQLGLETNNIVYVQPNQLSQNWLTTTARLQAAFGRFADFRPIQTSLVSNIKNVKPEQRLVIIGTPSEQPALTSLKLPLSISGTEILDINKRPVSEDTGVLIATRTKEKGGTPVLIATGNGPRGVAKAVQFLVQPDLRKMGTGPVIFVNQVKDVAPPEPRQWPRYIPEDNNFRLSDIRTPINGEPFSDVTVRGSEAPPVEINFRTLPDDRFLRGSTMNLVYSYGPQMNPRTSAIDVLLDGRYIGGTRLTADSGETRQTLKVDLPASLLNSESKLQVFFRMNPKEPFDKQKCLSAADQQLVGTLHAETNFDLKREPSVQLPDLKLLQFGFPFAAPQDLSKMAIVLPQNPSNTDILTLLALSERLGRLSQAEAIKFPVYTPESIPDSVRKGYHLVGIGTRDKFPFPEVFKSTGFNLSQAFSRVSAQGTIQTPRDSQGLIKQIISPWSNERVILALTSQTETGLERVRQVVKQDPLFFQLKQDTVLVGSDKSNPSPYDASDYQLEFFRSAPSKARVENTNFLSKISRLLQENWLLLPVGIIGLSLILYGIVQLYLKRLASIDRN